MLEFFSILTTSLSTSADTITLEFKKSIGLPSIALKIASSNDLPNATAQIPVFDVVTTALTSKNSLITLSPLSILIISRKDSGLLDLIYPVGAIYMSTSGTNPSNLFGGTWVAWGSGRVPVGVNGNDGNFNAVEKTGGQSTVTIASNNLPAHNHGVNDPGHQHTLDLGSYKIPTATQDIGDVSSSSTEGSYTAPSISGSTATQDWSQFTGTSLTPASSGTGISIQNAYGNAGGGADAMTNLQPYITCYMWKRTA